MKFKKLLISASAIAAGSGLLATVLTSCAKANIDEKQKIELNDQGLLYKPGKMGDKYNLSYTDAIKAALTRSTNWATFKNALADEIIFQWFTNRMSPSKESDEKNTNFRTSYDEWEYQINKDYDNTVQNCKNKYGSNWGFYLQNEYLAPYGGSEASYKHAKMVEKIKADFLSKVFAKNYFGYRQQNDATIYPHIYTKATKDINKNTLRNPKNWENIGFFARAELSFDPGETPKSYDAVLPNYLARHPDGDYAAIQDYVFNRWFVTEKPMFVSAALFKYSNPKYVAGGKLENIYDGTFTGVKVPTDKPSEAFPFFGVGDDCSTAKAIKFLDDIKKGTLATEYIDDEGEKQPTNHTITIPLSDSDDGQTCLLVCGNQMFTSLYTPYAMAVGNLYEQMLGRIKQTEANPNIVKSETIDNNFKAYKGNIDDFAMLSNFFYVEDPKETGITKSLDLNAVYGGLVEGTEDEYHCPLFQECTTYRHFYGNSLTKESGIRYITNNFQVNDFQSDDGKSTIAQPWVMELNEAGVHCLTIDGFNYVASAEGEDGRLANLKKAVMFRLMQKQINDDGAACISTDLLGESGKLKTYFNDNFTNIILELAMISKAEETTKQFSKYNVFRKIESYKVDPAKTEDGDLFLYYIWKDQSLGTAYDNLKAYIESLIGFETIKKITSTLETANNKIYTYRSKQITSSKSKEEYSKTVFENGLLAPFVYAPTYETNNNWTYDYSTVNRVILQDGDYYTFKAEILKGAQAAQKARLDNIAAHKYVTDVAAAKIDGESGFSPRIADAKNATSNRFWYKSSLVDKVMYAFMGNKSNTVNAIKMNAYQYYLDGHDATGEWFGGAKKQEGKLFGATASKNAFLTTYAKSKVLTSDKNLATYITKPLTTFGAEEFYTLMLNQYTKIKEKTEIENGITADDLANLSLYYATVMYLLGSEETGEKAKAFDNFYTVLNSKIGDDESAIIGYMTKGYNYTGAEEASMLDENPIGTITKDNAKDYLFSAEVDNLFDQHGYAGKDSSVTKPTDTKMSTNSYFNVIQKTFEKTGVTKDFAGFLGLQTKSSNQLDSASSLQSTVFGKLSKAIYNSTNIDTGKAYTQNYGCWFQFGGELDSRGNELTFPDFTYGSTTVKCDTWFPKGQDYAKVRKVAKKIVEYRTMDDLRALAKTLADAYDGYTYFSAIADGSQYCENVNDMKMKMLKLLPSTESKQHNEEWHAHDIETFLRVSNAEAHTAENKSSYVFKDTKGKNGYKLLLTQINKADALEKTLTPTWEGDAKAGTGKWVQGSSPITPEEFWFIFFNLANESTVQQRVITEIVKYAFGDEKLVVYDAQLYNQFDSVWIKDWAKKPMGA